MRILLRLSRNIKIAVLVLTITGCAFNARAQTDVSTALSGLTILSGTLSPVFNPDSLNYSVSVTAGTRLSFTPTVADSASTLTVDGDSFISGRRYSVSTAVGVKAIPIVVTSPDSSSTRTYMLTVTVKPSTDASLTDLEVYYGTDPITPAFSATGYNYTATVDAYTSQTDIYFPTASNQATILLNGSPVSSTDTMVNLNTGTNVFAIKVTAQDSVTTKTYNLTINRPPISSNASLANAVFSAGTLNTPFDSATLSYTLTPITAESVILTPTLQDSTAVMTINNTPASNKTAFHLLLTPGSNTITVTVKAQDSTTVVTYTFAVTRIVPPAPTLSYAAKSFTVGHAGSLSPAASGVDAPAYGLDADVLATGLYYIAAIATDPSGALYVAAGFNHIYKIPAGGGTPVLVQTNNYVYGLATDASSNLYATGASNTSVTKYPGGTGSGQPFGSGGLVSPNGLAIDPSGNVYTDDGLGNLYKITPGGTQSVVETNPNQALLGLAADSAANVYGGTDYGLVLRFNKATGTPDTLATGLNTPQSITVDKGNNVFVTNNNSVMMIPANTHTPVTVLTPASGLQTVMAGSQNTLYVGQGDQTLRRYKPIGGYFITPALPPGLVLDRATGIISGTPTAATPATNYTVTAYNSGGSTSATVSIATVLGVQSADLDSLIVSSGTLTPTFNPDSLNYKAEVTDDVNYLGIIADPADSTETISYLGYPEPSDSLFYVPLNEGDNSIPILVTSSDGSLSKTYTLTVHKDISADLLSLNISSGVLNPRIIDDPTINTFTASVNNTISSVTLTPTLVSSIATMTVNGQPLRSGTRSQSILLGVGQTTVTIVVTSPDTVRSFTVTINRGAAPPTIASGSSASLAEVYDLSVPITPLASPLSGIAPPAGYNSWPKVVNSTSFDTPTGIATDGAGNIYVADYFTGTVSKMTKGGGGKPVVVDSLSYIPYGIAVDSAANNLYIADLGGFVVRQVALTPKGQNVTFCVFAPTGVAVDRAGNMFVINNFNTLSEVKNDVNRTVVNIDTAFNNPFGVAVDTARNLYVADSADPDGKIIKFLPSGSGSSVTYGAPVKIGNGFNAAISVEPDAAGNVFVLDENVVKEIMAGSGTVTTLSDQFNDPFGIAVDKFGMVYVSDSGNSAVDVLQPAGGYTITPALPAGLSLDATSGTISGTPTKVQPATKYTLTGYNAGGDAMANITITIKASTDDNLSSLGFSGSALSPSFDPATAGYTASAQLAAETVTAVTEDPTATMTINGAPATSGVPFPITLTRASSGVVIFVKAKSGHSKNYKLVISKNTANDVGLNLVLNPKAILTTVSATTTTSSYSASVSPATATVTLTPTVHDPNASATVDSTPVVSGTASDPITLNTDGSPTVITTIVTAQDGTQRTYLVSISKNGSSDVTVSLKLSPAAALTLVGNTPAQLSYTTSVSPATTTVTMTPTTHDPNARATVDGVPVVSGTASDPITLNTDGTPTVITTIVTAQDGTQRSYLVSVSKNGSDVATASLKLTPAAVLTATLNTPAETDLTTTVSASVSSVRLTVTEYGTNAVITVNSATVASGTASNPIILNTDGTPTMITTLVTAEDGTQKTYLISISKNIGGSATASIAGKGPGILENQDTRTAAISDEVTVHHAVSPNGDGLNDVLKIDNIEAYPDNKLVIINTGGVEVYQAQGYNNSSRAFDGHSGINRALLAQGTYYYMLDYKKDGATMHKTGYFVLKY